MTGRAGRAVARPRSVGDADPAAVALPGPRDRARCGSHVRRVVAGHRRCRHRPPARARRPVVRRCHLRGRPVPGLASPPSGGLVRGVRLVLSRRHPDRPLHRPALGAAAVQPLLPRGAQPTQERRGRPGPLPAHLHRPRGAGRPRPGHLRPPAGLCPPPHRVGPRRRDPLASHPAVGAAADRGAGGGHRSGAGGARRRRGAAADRPGAARRRRAQHVPDRRAGRRRRARHPHRRRRRRARARDHRRDQPQGVDPDPLDAGTAPGRGHGRGGLPAADASTTSTTSSTTCARPPASTSP